ncbi:MAG TPA: SCO family protein [Bacteroidia bacterium]|jgi:protein SCO1/2|nr:SCO family protein [Bacteroidia bacterium]
MKKSTNVLLLIAGLLVLGTGMYFALSRQAVRTLPFYGDKVAGPKGDTTYHTVGPFSLINQLGKTITEKDLDGKIYVADYFFANCRSICPKMSSQLERVQTRFKNEPDFMILSHTVDPARDTVAALERYASMHQADPQKWFFLTGDKKQLYDLARHSYLVTATEGNGGAEDFVHTEQFALVDKEKHLRGFYDGTDSAKVSQLISDVEQLLLSYRKK